MLRCCLYHPVFSLEVAAEDNVFETGLPEEGLDWLSHFFMDLDEELAVRGHFFFGEMAEGPIEDQRVIVGNEQGHIGLEINDMGGHGGAFLLGNIGWIAYKGGDGRECAPGFWIEKVQFVKGEGEVMGFGVAAGDGEGFGAEVAGVDFGGGEMAGQGEGDAAAAGADVEDGIL